MDAHDGPPALVVIAGPQASGKSTVAAALAGALRREGEQVALVELDQVAGMALPTLPDWSVAHAIFETVTGMWARSGLTCVIAEGSGSQGEVAALLRQRPPGGVTVSVATTAAFDVALARAQADPTRGVSKEAAFLSAVYSRWPTELAAIAPDIQIDTAEVSVPEAVTRIQAAITAARSE